jgi:glycosyltransferase involved in cell wall biosynthesis
VAKLKNKISIITICYNNELDIERTMNSVVKQKYENIEYIIIDGLSTDETVNRAVQIKNNNPKFDIEIFSEKDYGISDAMNKGIEKSSGQLICHLHAGDYFTQDNVLLKVMKSYNNFHWQWGVGNSIVINQNGDELFKFKPGINKNVLKKKNCIPHQSTFIDRKLFEDFGVFKVDYKQAMDYELWLRFAFLGGKDFYILDFDVTYFLDGGTSTDIKSLVKTLWKIRKNGKLYNIKSNIFLDVVYVSRVILFNYYRIFKNIMQ